MVVPVEPVRKLGGDAPSHLVVLGAGGLVQGIGGTGQIAVSVVGVLGTLLGAVDLGGDLTQGVPLALVSSLAVYMPLIGYLGGWLPRIFAFPGSVGAWLKGKARPNQTATLRPLLSLLG